MIISLEINEPAAKGLSIVASKIAFPDMLELAKSVPALQEELGITEQEIIDHQSGAIKIHPSDKVPEQSQELELKPVVINEKIAILYLTYKALYGVVKDAYSEQQRSTVVTIEDIAAELN